MEVDRLLTRNRLRGVSADVAAAGGAVYAGSIDGDGVLDVEALCALGDAMISGIIEQGRPAQAGKAPIGPVCGVVHPLLAIAALGVMLRPPAVRLALGQYGDFQHVFRGASLC
jgi:cation transport ATPase